MSGKKHSGTLQISLKHRTCTSSPLIPVGFNIKWNSTGTHLPEKRGRKRRRTHFSLIFKMIGEIPKRSILEASGED